MKEYQKIPNIFKFNAKHQIDGLNEPFETLKDIAWVGTEKIDGTNIRIHWDGHEIEIAGRTDKAQLPVELKTYLDNLFLTQEMEYLFEQIFCDKEAFIFGEGYGAKIQNGGLYSPTQNFIVFGCTINGYELDRENYEDVARKLGLPCVPLAFFGTLEEAQKSVLQHKNSIINAAHEMEGLVLTPVVAIYDNNGNRLKCKCKYRDIMKGK